MISRDLMKSSGKQILKAEPEVNVKYMENY